MQSMFKQTNELIIEEEKSMHKNIYIKDSLKEQEYKLRELTRKLNEVTELWDIERERNELISDRIGETTRLIETL